MQNINTLYEIKYCSWTSQKCQQLENQDIFTILKRRYINLKFVFKKDYKLRRLFSFLEMAFIKRGNDFLQ